MSVQNGMPLSNNDNLKVVQASILSTKLILTTAWSSILLVNVFIASNLPCSKSCSQH